MLQCFSKKKSNGRNRFFECFSLTAQSALYGQTKRLYSSKQQLGEQGQCPEFLHHWLDRLKRFLQLLGSGFSFCSALIPWSHSSGDASFSPFLLWSSLCSSSASNLGCQIASSCSWCSADCLQQTSSSKRQREFVPYNSETMLTNQWAGRWGNTLRRPGSQIHTLLSSALSLSLFPEYTLKSVSIT
jgi:hypothetical protein